MALLRNAMSHILYTSHLIHLNFIYVSIALMFSKKRKVLFLLDTQTGNTLKTYCYSVTINNSSNNADEWKKPPKLAKWWSACKCDTKTARSLSRMVTMSALPKWRYNCPRVFSPQSSNMLSLSLSTQHWDFVTIKSQLIFGLMQHENRKVKWNLIAVVIIRHTCNQRLAHNSTKILQLGWMFT